MVHHCAYVASWRFLLDAAQWPWIRYPEHGPTQHLFWFIYNFTAEKLVYRRGIQTWTVTEEGDITDHKAFIFVLRIIFWKMRLFFVHDLPLTLFVVKLSMCIIIMHCLFYSLNLFKTTFVSRFADSYDVTFLRTRRNFVHLKRSSLLH